MPLDREKAFANAERLLKQGRVRPALEEYRRIAEEAPRDVLTLNRIGDVLARAGRPRDAVGFYEKAGEHFAQAGFYPRAVAIFKKIVKLDPTRHDIVVKLAELNVSQKLPAEARAYFLHAADAYLRARQFAQAREVYERLVAIDPSDVTNRVRLAETRAAEGNGPRAGEDLLLVAAQLASDERMDDAERTYKRASELLPDRPEPIAGLAACLARRGRTEDAVRTIDTALARRPTDPLLLGEKLVLLEMLGMDGAAGELLAAPHADGLRDDEIIRAFGETRARGAEETWLERLDPLFAAWRRTGRADRVGTLLDRLSLVVDRGWPPALERLHALRIEEGAEPRTIARVLERLIATHEAHGNTPRASELRAELSRIDLAAPAPAPAPAPAASRPEPAGAAARPAPEAPAETPGPAVPLAAEAPAVPLSPQDHEAVSGYLTEAEVFLKYGLHNEALGQLREVVKRFPGHVEGVSRLVALLRTRPERDALRDALVALGLARRAAGDHAGGREAVAEAVSLGGLGLDTAATLAKLGLVDPAALLEKRAPPPPPAPRAAPPPAPAPPSPPPRRAAPVPAADEDLVVDFEDDAETVEEEVETAPVAPVRPAGRPPRVATADMIEEIAFYLDQGMGDEALKKIAALRTLGFSGDDLDALEARAQAPAPEPAFEGLDDDARLDESELSSITAALEAEIAASPDAPAPAAETEQSIEEVFDQFKRHVEVEVGTEDFRTHYDLGIAYKEMGLIDDALEEFRVASRAPELFRDACSMLALCHRERGEADEAVRWYRAALDAASDESEPLSGVRYDLAEVLAGQGDYEGALALFQEVMTVDPSYRDVRRQVSDLKARLRL